MKIIKFKQKRSYSYKRKILIKDLVLNMLVGIHNFEKKKKQRVRFNLIINDLKNFTNLISELKQKELKFKIIRHKNKKYAFFKKLFSGFKKN